MKIIARENLNSQIKVFDFIKFRQDCLLVGDPSVTHTVLNYKNKNNIDTNSLPYNGSPMSNIIESILDKYGCVDLQTSINILEEVLETKIEVEEDLIEKYFPKGYQSIYEEVPKKLSIRELIEQQPEHQSQSQKQTQTEIPDVEEETESNTDIESEFIEKALGEPDIFFSQPDTGIDSSEERQNSTLRSPLVGVSVRPDYVEEVGTEGSKEEQDPEVDTKEPVEESQPMDLSLAEWKKEQAESLSKTVNKFGMSLKNISAQMEVMAKFIEENSNKPATIESLAATDELKIRFRLLDKIESSALKESIIKVGRKASKEGNEEFSKFILEILSNL